MNSLNRIRELAPSSGGAGHGSLRREWGKIRDVGIVTVETVSNKTTLGEVDLGLGNRPARLLVLEDGLSRGSGCEVFTPFILLVREDSEVPGQQG